MVPLGHKVTQDLLVPKDRKAFRGKLDQWDLLALKDLRDQSVLRVMLDHKVIQGQWALKGSRAHRDRLDSMERRALLGLKVFQERLVHRGPQALMAHPDLSGHKAPKAI